MTVNFNVPFIVPTIDHLVARFQELSSEFQDRNIRETMEYMDMTYIEAKIYCLDHVEWLYDIETGDII